MPQEAGHEDPSRLRRPGLAYLLSVVGTSTSRAWEERMRGMELDPREVVVLRMVAAEPGRSQRSLGPALHVRPSHLVAVIDSLERQRLVERQPNPADRRAHALYLTRRGKTVLAAVMRASVEHEEALVSDLTASERESLEALLVRIARRQGLAEGGHPGFDPGGDEGG